MSAANVESLPRVSASISIGELPGMLHIEIDRRNLYFYREDFIIPPDGEFDISVYWDEGRSGEKGWPAGYWWHLESAHGTLVSHTDFGGSLSWLGIDDWLVPLTGYRREEFVKEFLSDDAKE